MSAPESSEQPIQRRAAKTSRILIPAFPSVPIRDLLGLAAALKSGHRILLLGVVPVDEPRSLSEAAPDARKLRGALQRESANSRILAHAKVRVSHHPEYEISSAATEAEAGLVLVPWICESEPLHGHLRAVLEHVPVDLGILAGQPPAPGSRILVVLRGGSDSELALRLALRLAPAGEYKITAIRLAEDEERADDPSAMLGLDQVLAHLPQIEQVLLYTDQPERAILQETERFDLVIVPGRGHADQGQSWINRSGLQLIEQARCPVLVARSRPPAAPEQFDQQPGLEAISILVDKWFAENTFHADEFADLRNLYERKQALGLSVSLALPALDEEETVGNVIRTVRRSLQEEVPLLDEIVLMDSNSSDRTREIAANLGVPVHIHQEVLPQYGAREGKGEALWKSLYVTRGDLVLWIDTDIVNIHPRFIYGLLGPLLLRQDLMFVKGFYLRPMRVGKSIQAGGGGRVTELTARPLLNLFYPALSGLIQPLSGEYAGRREALERLPFSSGYGVETGLLIDLLRQFGLGSIGQVDMIKRIHHNQPLAALSMMSFAIIQTVMRKLDRDLGLELLKDVNRSMKIIRHLKGQFFLEVERIAERERPPMISIPEYAERSARAGGDD